MLEGPDVLKISTEIEAGGQSFANDCTPELPTGVASFANQYHETTLRENQYHKTTSCENQYPETTSRANQYHETNSRENQYHETTSCEN